jgi:RasGEF domain
MQTSCWVATEICTQPQLKPRVKTIEKFIKIAKECKRLNQYNALLAIVSGLNLVAVSRLKQTWEVPQSYLGC